MAIENYYEVLGVPKTASAQQIRKAFRQIGQDKDKHPGERQAQERFAAASIAFDVLIDPVKREKYDRSLQEPSVSSARNRFMQLPFLPHVVAIVLFVVVGFVYFSPVLQGKSLNQSDMTLFQGMSKEAMDYYNRTGQDPLWSNSMFSGMPTYTTFDGPTKDLVSYVSRVVTLFLPGPVNMLFIAMLGFYVLTCVLGFRYWIRLFGSVAFGLSSFNLILIGAGHVTEILTFSYLAPVLAGILLTYRRKYILGGALTLISTALMVYSDHLQILYYALIIIFCLVIFEFIVHVKEKRLEGFFKASGILAIAGVLAIIPSAGNLMITKEYAKYSTRESQSRITLQNKYNAAETGGGLDIDYAYQWSMGKMESFSILVPNIYGGPPSADFLNSSNLYNVLTSAGQSPDQAQSLASNIGQNFYYWGPQPFTTPVYFGVVVCLLFILSFFLVRGWQRWWLLVITVIGFFLSWGKNFAGLNDFLFYHLPLYDKFRSPSMALVIPELTFVILACWALEELCLNGEKTQVLWKAVRSSLIITGAIVLVLVSGMLLDFNSPRDAQLPQMLGGNSPVVQRILGALHDDRVAMLHSDGLRSLILVVLAGILLWALVRKKIKWPVFAGLFSVLMLFDLVGVDKRYVNNDQFVDPDDQSSIFQASQADQSILQDKDPYYRVLNLTPQDIFSDAVTSYWHKSIGGYSPAKLWRYQDLIDFQIQPAIQRIISTLQGTGHKDSTLLAIFFSSPVLNMLNTKYFIINPSAPPVRNRLNCGNAWFVNTIERVPDANSEILALSDFNPADTVIVNSQDDAALNGFTPHKDSSSYIRLTQYGLNELDYASGNSVEGLGVFSDIYYPAGWKAYIDGKESEIYRVNYALRGLRIPAGTHQIIFRFHPDTFFRGERISLFGSIFLLLVFFASLVYAFTLGRTLPPPDGQSN